MPYESVVSSIFGHDWRKDSRETQNGAVGIAIVKSIADGVDCNINDISNHLSIERRYLREAFMLLSLNGIFIHDRIKKDSKNIKMNDPLALGYYAGYAAGLIGPFNPSEVNK